MVIRLEQQKTSLPERAIDTAMFRLDIGAALRHRYGRTLLQAARQAIRERGTELLEMEETFGLAELVRPRLGIPVVVHLHGPHFVNGLLSGVPPDKTFHRRVRWEGAGIARADAVVSVSQDVLDRTRAAYELPLERASVIPGPAPVIADEHQWRLADCEPQRLLFVGRFDRHKGGDVMVNCMRILRDRFPDIRLWFMGRQSTLVDDEGREWSPADYVARHAPEAVGSIDWLGLQPQAVLDELRRRAAITVVASRYETFGAVAIEAMAHGSPLVATRTGGIPEMVKDGVNGLLCEPADAGDMASKISQLLTDLNLAARLGERAREDARSYHADRIARDLVAYYRTVLEEFSVRS
jgi:glycosyltransferase involved in cell wall biosynthesis